uniref:Coiled-coil domain-containing protein n=1 Tax=Angiostrongylus cantonensis TaxID=6313 RepID=A0A0K0CW36_ANGCA
LQQAPQSSRAGQVTQTQMRLSNDNDEKRISQLLDTYFLDQPAPSTSTWATSNHQTVQVKIFQIVISYQGGTLVTTTNVKGVNMNVKVSPVSPDKAEKERLKKARQAEAARMRYHRLTPAEKRELNLKRTLAQKRKRQREKELEELESILRETNDIQEDPDITEQLREKRMRAKWAEAARQRYARMTPEERRAHNNRRRMRQMQNALAAVKAAGGTGDPIKDEEAVRAHIKAQNAKKAEAARQRYHRMTEEEKRIYNQRRTEAFRRRRMEEEMLLAMPIGRINGEALDRAQQIVVRNAKRAEAARLRYQRMTPDQRKVFTRVLSYNQKRYTPKRRRLDGMDSMLSSSGGSLVSCKKVHLTFSVLLTKFIFLLSVVFVNLFATASSFAVRGEG